MTQLEKDNLFYKVKDFCEYIETRCCDLMDKQWDVIERDLDLTVKSLKDDEDAEDFLSTVLDAHMDTVIKTILNIVVSVLTEHAMEKQGLSIELPDPVEFALNNKDLYNIN